MVCNVKVVFAVQALPRFHAMVNGSEFAPELPIAECGGDVVECEECSYSGQGGVSCPTSQGGVSCPASSSAEVIQDSDEEFLEELLTVPAQSYVSDDEFLDELLKAPEGTTPGTLQILRDSEASVASIGSGARQGHLSCQASMAVLARGAAQGGESCPAPKPKRKPKSGDIPCHGCPDEMMDLHAKAMVQVSFKNSYIEEAGLRVMIRDCISNFSPQGLDQLAVNLQQQVFGVLEHRGICIFKIGITRDPVWRMFNPGFGYAVYGDPASGELFSSMNLLVASFPAVCAYLEAALIRMCQSRPGCRNILPGGESAPKAGLCYVYVVSEPCGQGKPTRKRRAKASTFGGPDKRAVA